MKNCDIFYFIIALLRCIHISMGSFLYRVYQKYSRLRSLLCVKGLVFCFYLDWSGSILQFRQIIIKVGSKLSLVQSHGYLLAAYLHTLVLLWRESKNFVTAILVCCIFGSSYKIVGVLHVNSKSSDILTWSDQTRNGSPLG